MKELQSKHNTSELEQHRPDRSANPEDAIAYLESLEIERSLEARRNTEDYKEKVAKKRKAAAKYAEVAKMSKEDALKGSYLDLRWYKSNRKLYIKGTGAYLTQRELIRFILDGGDFSVEEGGGKCCKSELLYRLCALRLLGENTTDHRRMLRFIREGV